MDDELKKYRYSKTAEQTLKQWLSLESVNANGKSFVANYDTAMRGSEPLTGACKCDSCDYVANTIAEIQWHESRNPGHEVL
jgi:hypothetical protein